MENISRYHLIPTQKGGHLADGIFQFIFLKRNVLSFIPIWLKFVIEGPTDNKWDGIVPKYH